MKNKKLLLATAIIMALTLGGIAFYYWYKSNHYVDTEDARVDGTIIKVSPQVSGKIIELNFEEGDKVQEGDVIARQVDTTLPPGSNLELTVIKAPVSGIVLKKVANVGEVIAPGQAIVMLADLSKVYITANIEETELNKVHVGQKVSFTVDSIPGYKFHGRVAFIGEATISTFSLLPTLNANGNFTKVVQRVPVKIIIDDFQKQRLLPGVNAVVRIYIR